jgi:heme-degrading monooxygenase HmoA
MYARSGLITVAPDKVDDAVHTLEAEHLPRYHDQRGYKGFTALADRASGKVLGISFWDSKDDVSASDALGEQARNSMSEAGGGNVPPTRDVWEVVLDETV